MNLRDFKYLEAVAKHKNFRKAADASFVSQPTLSMQIKKMEEYLGIKLIERNSKNILFTEAGKEILQKAREINLKAEEIKDIAENYKNPLAANLKIGAFPTLSSYYFPKIIPTIKSELPDLKLFLYEEKTEVLISKLLAGKIDAAFLASPIEENNFDNISIFEEEFYLAVSQSNKMSNISEASLDSLNQKTLLLLDEGHCLRDQALQVCSLTGAKENKHFRASSLETLRAMVAADMGITLMPEIAVKKDDNIKYIPFAKKHKPTRKIALYFRSESIKKNILKNITDLIK